VAAFVYAVSERASVGRPFPEAVAAVAREVDLGPLERDVADLAFNLSVTTTGGSDVTDGSGVTGESEGGDVQPAGHAAGGRAGSTDAAGRPVTDRQRVTDGRGEVRGAALDRFVERVGTPLADRTVGLVSGALHAGSTVDDVFGTLRVEVDRLTHEKRALRAAMRRYVSVGWVAALVVAGTVAAINAQVMEADSETLRTNMHSAKNFQRADHWPKPLLVRYVFFTRNDVDLERGLWVLLSAGAGASFGAGACVRACAGGHACVVVPPAVPAGEGHKAGMGWRSELGLCCSSCA